MDYFCGGGARDSFLFSSRWRSRGVIRIRMASCLCFFRAKGFAPTLAISRTFLLLILLCGGRGLFDCRRNMAGGFTPGFATRGISRAHRFAHRGSFSLRRILVCRACGTDIRAAARNAMAQGARRGTGGRGWWGGAVPRGGVRWAATKTGGRALLFFFVISSVAPSYLTPPPPCARRCARDALPP